MARKVEVPMRLLDVPFFLELGGCFAVVCKSSLSRLDELSRGGSATGPGATYSLPANTCSHGVQG